MISGTYILSGGLLAVTAWLFKQGTLNATTQTAAWVIIFFFASAGASAAYLTVSEIFPMETRAMAIAFFYAIGTAAGGISGPLLFGVLIASGKRGELAIGYLIGAILMIAAGLVEVWLGVNAEQKPLEEIATPLTAEDAGQPAAEDGGQPARVPAGADAAVATGTAQRRQRRRVEPALTPQAPYRLWSPMPPVYAAPLIDTARDREVEEIAAALAGAGPVERRRLAQLVHADLWGPGRFSPALRQAVVQGRVRRTGRGLYALVPGPPDPGGDLPADDARHGDGTGHQR
jgi:Major Facilitator Superfamily